MTKVGFLTRVAALLCNKMLWIQTVCNILLFLQIFLIVLLLRSNKTCESLTDNYLNGIYYLDFMKQDIKSKLLIETAYDVENHVNKFWHNKIYFKPHGKSNITNEFRMSMQKGKHYLSERTFTTYIIKINANNSTGKLHHFWKSTGLCPPDPHQQAYHFLLSPDMEQNLGLLGALPGKGIQQIRIHWLLNLISAQITQEGNPVFNFTNLDKLIHSLWKNGLHPGFELMGNPSNIFSNFENKTEVRWWRSLVEELSNRYIGLYGINYVEKWNFETWNEPDHHDFDGLNITLKGFLNYYDASQEGLKMTCSKLKLGGPGGSCHAPSTGRSPLCWSFLDHCAKQMYLHKNQNNMTLDFISFHKKGDGIALNILEKELETIHLIQQTFPSLASVPVVNDEADPLVGWSKPLLWRADATYGALVAKVIGQHIQTFVENQKMPLCSKCHYKLLSNDNAFLSFFPHQFEQRTLLARFQMNNTAPPHVQFFKKPVYAVTGILGKLGETLLNYKLSCQGSGVPLKHHFGIIPTMHKPDKASVADNLQFIILMYNSADTTNMTGISSIKVYMEYSLPKTVEDLKWTCYIIDNFRTNPFSVWLQSGRPVFPSPILMEKMRHQENPFRLYTPQSLKHPPWKFHLKLPLPGIALLHICAKGSPPEKIHGVRVIGVNNCTVLIVWKDLSTCCLLTYEVEFWEKGGVTGYRRINTQDIMFPSFQFSCFHGRDVWRTCSVTGLYRVRAVDFWDQKGHYSHPVYYVYLT